MNIYPFSVWINDAPIVMKLLGVFSIVLCVLFVMWVYRRQKGINLIKEMNEPTNKIRKIPNWRKLSQKLPDTASALLNKADSISVVTYPEKVKEITPLINKESKDHIEASILDEGIGVNHKNLEGRGVNQ